MDQYSYQMLNRKHRTQEIETTPTHKMYKRQLRKTTNGIEKKKSESLEICAVFCLAPPECWKKRHARPLAMLKELQEPPTMLKIMAILPLPVQKRKKRRVLVLDRISLPSMPDDDAMRQIPQGANTRKSVPNFATT